MEYVDDALVEILRQALDALHTELGRESVLLMVWSKLPIGA